MKRQTARVGQEFQLALPAVPATGHQWELQAGGENVEIVRRESGNPGLAIGGATTAAITLKPKKAGDFVLQFGLKRPWESEIAETATVEVSVSPTKAASSRKTAKASPKPAVQKPPTAKSKSPKR